MFPKMAAITDFQLYCIIVSILCLISTFLIRSIFSFATKTHLPPLPPSPPSLPLIGHLHLLSPSIYTSFHNLSTKYGPLLYLRFGASRCVLVSSASAAAEIFKTHDLSFSSRPVFALADKTPYGTSGFITAPYGDYWKFMNKLCLRELLSPRQLERSRAVRREELLGFVSKVVESARKKEVVDVGAELMRLTNNITCRMVMSTRCSEKGSEAEKVRKMVRETFELAAKMCFGDVLGPLKMLSFWMYGKQAINVTERYDDLFERILNEHEHTRKNKKKNKDKEEEDVIHKDFMDILLDVYEDDEAEFKITRTQIKAFLLDLFIGGTDTSAAATQWAMAELINHPDKLKKLREEIESAVGTTNRLVQESDIPKLPYLQAVVKETLRLHPPGPVTTRECRQDCTIRGFRVPEKTAVAINLYAIMRDPEAWTEPDEFRPERFLVTPSGEENCIDDDDEIKEQNLNFVPFGAGRRGCPGTLLAYSMMNCALAAMVQCFDWKVGDGEGDGDCNNKVDMRAGSGMTMGMARPLVCLPVLHFDPFAA